MYNMFNTFNLYIYLYTHIMSTYIPLIAPARRVGGPGHDGSGLPLLHGPGPLPGRCTAQLGV